MLGHTGSHGGCVGAYIGLRRDIPIHTCTFMCRETYRYCKFLAICEGHKGWGMCT